MKTFKNINIKNRPYYFFNNMINIKDFDRNSLNINQITFEKYVDYIIYNNEYFKHFDSASSLYLIFNNLDEYFEYH